MPNSKSCLDHYFVMEITDEKVLINNYYKKSTEMN